MEKDDKLLAAMLTNAHFNLQKLHHQAGKTMDDYEIMQAVKDTFNRYLNSDISASNEETDSFNP